MSSPSRRPSGWAGCKHVAKALAFCTAALVVLGGDHVFPQRAAWTFDDMAPGRPPAGFVFSDAATAWQVARDGSNAVLAHTAQGGAAAHLAIVESTSIGSVSLSARLRFPEGPGAAGIAWRYRDAANYYAVALDLRAQNVRIYRVVAGNRTRLEDEDDFELDAASWHSVKVEDDGLRVQVWIDGVPVAGARDRARPEPGAIGVWTAGDAGVWFDDLRAEPRSDAPRSNRRD